MEFREERYISRFIFENLKTFSFIVFYHSVSAEFYKADYLFIIVQERDLKEIGKRKGIGE